MSSFMARNQLNKRLRAANSVQTHILPFFSGMEGDVIREAMEDYEKKVKEQIQELTPVAKTEEHAGV